MKKYPAYKSIKGTFYEQLPCDWNQLYLKQVCSEKCIKNTDNKETNVLSLSYGRIIKKKNINSGLSPKDFATYQIIKPNDIILRLTDLQNDHKSLRTGISEQTGIITSAYTCLTEIKNSRFLHYVLHSMDLNKVFYRLGSGVRQSLSYGDIRYLPVPAPSMQEQQQIVRYLDWKTSQINHLIHGYERLISLLEERKTAVINEAVTKGVRKGVTMKDSGVDGIGQIPAHWQAVKLRNILRPFSEKNHAELPLLSVVRERGVILRDVESKESNHNFIPDDLSNYKLVKKGQLAMNKMKAWQGSYGVSKYTGIVSPAYYVFDVNFPNLDFFHIALRSRCYVNFFAQSSGGIRVGQWDLSLDKMKEISFFFPTENEQEEIIKYINEEVSKINNIVEKISRETVFLRERRTRLISDVVTGELDVRDVVVPEYAWEQDMEVTEDGDEYEGERAGETDC